MSNTSIEQHTIGEYVDLTISNAPEDAMAQVLITEPGDRKQKLSSMQLSGPTRSVRFLATRTGKHRYEWSVEVIDSGPRVYGRGRVIGTSSGEFLVVAAEPLPTEEAPAQLSSSTRSAQ